jgi:signal transduction histidine kinase
VNALLGRMAAFLTRLGTVSGAGQLEVDLLLSPDPGWIAGDEALFSNALLNLAANSRDAMPTGGRVALRTALVDVGPGVDRQLRVDVVDTGAGIPEELLPKVFDPFFTTKREGTGLGLCSVRRTVEGHGGSVKVASRVGEGTTVTILVPLADPP